MLGQCYFIGWICQQNIELIHISSLLKLDPPGLHFSCTPQPVTQNVEGEQLPAPGKVLDPFNTYENEQCDISSQTMEEKFHKLL